MTLPLDRLPPPDAVTSLSFEELRDAAVAELRARVPDYDPVATDPAVRILEVAAYIRLLVEGRVNDAVRGTWLATAVGADLDQVGAAVNVARLEGEADKAFRLRIQLAWSTLSTAGPADAYRFHALSVPGVREVGVDSPSPGEVRVVVLADTETGVADAALIAAVTAALDNRAVRPVTDTLTVQSVATVAYNVEAALAVATSGPDLGVVRAAAVDAVLAHGAVRAIGRDVHRSALFSACHVPGVESVRLAQPAADVAVTNLQVAVLGAVAITAQVG